MQVAFMPQVETIPLRHFLLPSEDFAPLPYNSDSSFAFPSCVHAFAFLRLIAALSLLSTSILIYYPQTLRDAFA